MGFLDDYFKRKQALPGNLPPFRRPKFMPDAGMMPRDSAAPADNGLPPVSLNAPMLAPRHFPATAGEQSAAAGNTLEQNPVLIPRKFPPMNLRPPVIEQPAEQRKGFGDLPPIRPPMNIEPDNPLLPDLPPVGRGAGVGLQSSPTAEDAQRAFAPNSLELPPPPTPFPVAAPVAAKNGFGDLPPIQTPTLSDSEATAAKIAQIENKRYGFQKDASGNILRDENGKPRYEKDRDSDHNWWDVVKSAGLGFLNGGIGGAVAGGVQGAFDRNADEKMIDRIKTARLNETYANQVKREDAKLGQDYKRAQIENVYADNETAAANAATRKVLARRNILLRQIQTMKRYKQGENPAFDERLKNAGIE